VLAKLILYSLLTQFNLHPLPKEIKMTNEVVFTESTPLISKDIYRTYRHCRNIEISHLWQYSISPITFIVFCLSAYGYLPV